MLFLIRFCLCEKHHKVLNVISMFSGYSAHFCIQNILLKWSLFLKKALVNMLENCPKWRIIIFPLAWKLTKI